MTASYIPELDSDAVEQKVLTELLDTDKHATAGVLYANGVIVAAATPLPTTDAALTALPQARAGTVASGQLGIAALAIRQDTIAAIAEADGRAAMPRLDANGATRVYLNGALDASIDSIFVRPYSPGAVPGYFGKRYTTTADEVVIAAPGAGYRIVVTNCRISCRGTTAGQITVYADADADVDFDAGEKLIADDNYAPTALVPVGSKSGPLYIECAENKAVAVLSSAGISFTLMLDYFVESIP